MSLKIPVFPKGSLRLLPVHTEPSKLHTASCTDCKFNEGAKTVCIRPEGKPGGLLIISDYPGQVEDQYGRPMVGPAGQWMRGILSKHWQGPWAITNALGCIPDGDVKEDHISACRKYVVKTLEDVQPELILLMGGWAGLSVFGEKYKPLSSLGGYGWWCNPKTGKMVPVVMLPNPAAAVRNTIIMRAFEEQFAKAIQRFNAKSFDPPDETLYVELVDHTNIQAAVDHFYDEADYVAFDTETSGLMYTDTFRVESIVMWGVIGGNPSKGYLWDREQIEDPVLAQELSHILAEPSIGKCGFNAKYDIQAVFNEPLLGRFRGFYSDARLKRKLLAADADGSLAACSHMIGIVGHKQEAEEIVSVISAELNKLASYRENARTPGAKPKKLPVFKYINPQDVPDSTTDALEAGHDPRTFAYRYIPRGVRRRYNALDVLSTILVEEWANKQIVGSQFEPVWEEITKPATIAMVEMEREGIEVDQAKMQAFSQLLESKIKLEKIRLEAIQPGINPNSPPQVAAVLTKLGLKTKGKTSTGKMSTNEQALESLKGKHIFVDSLLECRRLSKLQSTYADGYQLFIRKGKIHTSYLLDGTESGRPSSSNPNMSVLPRSKDAEGNTEGQLLRDCFVAPEGYVFMEVDRKQIEIYMAAWLSKDPVMMGILMQPGADFHLASAKLFSKIAWGIEPEAVTPEHRQTAKCFHPDTEVLTRTGWQKIKELKPRQEVVQCHPERDGKVSMTWCVPNEVFTMKHPSEKLIHLQNKGIDLRVTPDHRMLEWTTAGSPKVTDPAGFGHAGSYWAGAGVLGGEVLRDVPSDVLLRLAVALQADGSIQPHKAVTFGFSRERKKVRLRSLLEEAGIPFAEREAVQERVTSFRITAKDAEPFRSLLLGKSFPWSWLSLPQKSRKVILEEAKHWDGSIDPFARRYTYAQRREENVEFLQALASVSGQKTRKTYNGQMHVLSVKDHAFVRGRYVNKTELVHTEDVACLSVPSSFVLVRDGGVPVVCGQTTNFAALYELPDKLGWMLAKRLKCPVPQGEAIAQALFGNFKRLRVWMSEQLAKSRATGYTETEWNGRPARRRMLWSIGDITQSGEGARENAERSSWNSPDQGTSADYTTADLLPVMLALRKAGLDAKPILTIYDSIIFKVHKDDLHEAATVVRQVMSRHDLHPLKLDVDVKAGPTLGTMKELKE